MQKGHIIQIDKSQLIRDHQQVVARLNLPAGKYLIFARANVGSRVVGRRFDIEQIFEARLVCGTEEDKVLMSLFPRIPSGMMLGDFRPAWADAEMYRYGGPQGGREVVVSFNIGVTIRAGAPAELQISSYYAEGIAIDHATISAIQLEELTISTEIPAAQKWRNPFISENELFSSQFNPDIVKPK